MPGRLLAKKLHLKLEFPLIPASINSAVEPMNIVIPDHPRFSSQTFSVEKDFLTLHHVIVSFSAAFQATDQEEFYL